MMTAASKRAARRVGIPILVYHHISSPSGSSPFLHVSPAAFAQQMCWLHGRGYHAVTLRQVFDFWAYNEPIPRKPIVITFDDGWRTVYTAAAPVLKRYAWPGVINEVVWAIDANYGMTKGQLLRLIKRGWEINSHTVSHAMLTQVPQSKLTEELESSRYRLSHNLHTTVDFLCYPGGLYDSTVIRAVRAAGYKGALSIWGGLARWKERWTLRRITATESGFQIPSQ
jgi:peptidoglycan/xylan/chitin deacetylase (PgdA/CDA1 family)